MQKKRKRNSTALTSENGFIGRPFTNCFLHHYPTLYESAEFKAWHDDLISEIARKYPAEEVGVILTDSF
jgi:hypothetical protein